ncbi:MAG TPA: hypothetical protein PLP01_01475 [Phycisphaerae bacterium]|nr:hypothetical protein [Phycisphaerae bacterium]HOI53897.1 hypothetical protein [Phycisphaerae bacterium]
MMVVRVILAVCVMACMVAAAPWAEARAAEALPEPQLYGLYTWAANYVRYADDIQKTGIRWVRTGGWDGKATDDAALTAARNGVHLTPSLFLNGLSHSRTMPVDEAVAAFREQARASVLRYGPGGTLWKEHADVKPLPIRYWQIWNEPNIEFLNPGESGLLRTELYAKLLKAATEEIRKADPGAQIIAFNTAGGVPDSGQALKADGMFQKLKYIGWRKFIRDVTELAGTGSYDYIGTHPYTMPRSPEAGGLARGVEMIREWEKEAKLKAKPIWFTEVGFPIEYPNQRQVRDERQQACFTVRLFALAGVHGATQVQVMYVEDIVYGPDNSRRSFGFFIEPGKWREQAKATRVMARLIPDPRKDVRTLSEKVDGVCAFEFKGPGGEPVLMAWNAGEGAVEHEFDGYGGKGATLVDMLGNVSRVEAEGGKVKLKLTEAPVYVLSERNWRQVDVEKLLSE